MKQIWSALCALVLTAALPVTASAQELVLGGQPVGIELQTDGVVVAGFAEVETETGICSPAKEAGLREGDRIVQIGDTPVTAAEDLVRAVGELQGETAEITVQRGETSQTLPVQSVRSADGQWMLGLWLRDESSGIGTLTFYDPSSGRYGALGHGVTDETSGETLPIRGGRITEAQIVSVTPGSPGTPGELTGCAERSSALGSIEKNCEKGIYGEAGAVLGEGSAEVGTPTPGPASMLTTLEGRRVKAYAVEISRVYTEEGVQRMLLTVTDPLLRELAGGIVQGMSGSPILQDGRIVGAVTHVLVSDPCRGFGIGIADMLAEAGIAPQDLAA
jgi:stage IV sporulation protein B